jgi:hypothetical protein
MDHLMPICNKLISTRYHFHTMSRSDLWPTLPSIQCVLRPLSQRQSEEQSFCSIKLTTYHDMGIQRQSGRRCMEGGGTKKQNQMYHQLIITDVNSTTIIPIEVMIHSITMWNMLLMFISCATNLSPDRLLPFLCCKCWATQSLNHYTPFYSIQLYFVILYAILFYSDTLKNKPCFSWVMFGSFYTTINCNKFSCLRDRKKGLMISNYVMKGYELENIIILTSGTKFLTLLHLYLICVILESKFWNILLAGSNYNGYIPQKSVSVCLNVHL